MNVKLAATSLSVARFTWPSPVPARFLPWDRRPTARELSDADGMLAWSVHAADDGAEAVVPSAVYGRRAARRVTRRVETATGAAAHAHARRGVDSGRQRRRAHAEARGVRVPIVDVAQKVNVDLIPVNPTDIAPEFLRPSMRLWSAGETRSQVEPECMWR